MDYASLFFDVLLIVQLFIGFEQLSTTTEYVKFVGFSAHLGYIDIYHCTCLFIQY